MRISPLLTAAAMVLCLTATACVQEQSAEETTISPATPPPATTPTDTDLALTQTTEVGEDRSPNEGGVLTDPSYGGTATTTATDGQETAPDDATEPPGR